MFHSDNDDKRIKEENAPAMREGNRITSFYNPIMNAGQAIAKLARIQHLDPIEFDGLTVRQAILECGLSVKAFAKTHGLTQDTLETTY
jgi:hypothetical protein